jgi:WD40 repeat protein
MDGMVLLWTLGQGEALGDPVVLEGHDGPVFFVAFDSYGQWLISGSADGTARLWDLKGVHKQSIVLHQSSADMDLSRISPDHRQLVTTDYEGTARVWDLRRADPRERPNVLYGHPGTFSTFSVSPDGRLLVSGATDGTVRIWDLQSPSRAPIALRGHRSAITSVRFTPDTRWVITADRQGLIRMWGLRLDELIRFTHRIVGRQLTATERRAYLAPSADVALQP